MTPSVVTAMTILIIVILVFAGVVLPAVWSRRVDRRCAAAGVLDKILQATVNVVIVLRPQSGI